MNMAAFIEQCRQQLWDGSLESQAAVDYLLRERRLRLETIRNFGIGFCRKGQELPDGESHRNALLFEKKLVVPINDEFGVPVAIAARSPSAAKENKGWYNSSRETGFTKEHHLFMLGTSRRDVFQQNKAYLFEGYFDGIVVYQAGLKNTCVPMGTALSLRGIGLLRRYCSEVCICFDADKNEAGQYGQAKSVLEMSRAGFKMSCIELPLGMDPDVYVSFYGLEKLRQIEQPVTPDKLQYFSDFVAQYQAKKKGGK
jgi:DNA primase